MGEREAAAASRHGGEVEMGWHWASVGRHYTPCGPGVSPWVRVSQNPRSQPRKKELISGGEGRVEEA